jgi:hypothetical protein
MTVKNLTTTISAYPYQKLFWLLTYALLALLVLYLYFVSTIVVGVVKMENLRSELGVLQSSVNELESNYVSLSGSVTMDLARQLGYQDAINHASFAYEANLEGVALSYSR